MAKNSQTSPASPAQPAQFRASKIANTSVNCVQKRALLWVQNGVPGPVPDHAERPQTTDSGTPSRPIQQRYELKSHLQTPLKWLSLASLPDQCNRGTSKNTVHTRVWNCWLIIILKSLFWTNVTEVQAQRPSSKSREMVVPGVPFGPMQLRYELKTSARDHLIHFSY